jgi:hypothetical protein
MKFKPLHLLKITGNSEKILTEEIVTEELVFTPFVDGSAHLMIPYTLSDKKILSKYDINKRSRLEIYKHELPRIYSCKVGKIIYIKRKGWKQEFNYKLEKTSN